MSNPIKIDFNPLHYRMLFQIPKRRDEYSAWIEHVPFGMMLVEMVLPRVIVELGSFAGTSYCAFCQSVAVLGIGTKCYAVDTWTGDEHGGFYGPEVYESLKRHNIQYESFSTLLRMTFDEATNHVPDGAVDLLHIDGMHSYEAARHDYETWLPKMSDSGLILFHDTAVRERGFGVYRLWDEITKGRRHFNFDHGFGLEVLAVGKNEPGALASFFDAAEARSSAIRSLFSSLGGHFQLGVELRAEKERRLHEKRLWERRWQNRTIFRRGVNWLGRKLSSPGKAQEP